MKVSWGDGFEVLKALSTAETACAPGEVVFAVVHVYVFDWYGLVVSVTAACVKPVAASAGNVTDATPEPASAAASSTRKVPPTAVL